MLQYKASQPLEMRDHMLTFATQRLSEMAASVLRSVLKRPEILPAAEKGRHLNFHCKHYFYITAVCGNCFIIVFVAINLDMISVIIVIIMIPTIIIAGIFMRWNVLGPPYLR